MVDPPMGYFRDMDHPLNASDIHKGTEVGQFRHLPFALKARLESRQGLF